MKRHWRLPVADPANHTLAVQEATQAPLYYLLGAIVIALIDTSNAADFYQRRPDSPLGRADIPGPKHMFRFRGDRSFPYVGTMFAVKVLRLFSMLLGVCTLYFTFRCAQVLATDHNRMALFATAFVAFNPMFLFINNSVNNDALVTEGVSLGIYLILRSTGESRSARHYAALGLLAGAITLAKLSGLILAPVLLASALLNKSLRLEQRCAAVLAFSFGFLAISGWWFLRNWLHYDDWDAFRLHAALAGGAREHYMPLAVFREWSGFLKSYCGVFGGFNVIYPDWIYSVLFAIMFVGASSFVAFLVQTRLAVSRDLYWLVLLAVINFVTLAHWTGRIMGSQGRLMFPSVGAAALLFAVGLEALPPRIRDGLMCSIVGFLLATALYGVFWVIPGAYQA